MPLYDIGPWSPGDLRPYGYLPAHARASVGTGWGGLVTAVLERLVTMCNEQVLAAEPHAQDLALIHRVGVSDGQLVVSVPTVHPDALRLLRAAAELSQQICERCGYRGRPVRRVPSAGTVAERHVLCWRCESAYYDYDDDRWTPEHRWRYDPDAWWLARNPSAFPPGWGPLGRAIERQQPRPDLGPGGNAAPAPMWQPNQERWSPSAEDRPWRPGVDEEDDRRDGEEREPWQG